MLKIAISAYLLIGLITIFYLKIKQYYRVIKAKLKLNVRNYGIISFLDEYLKWKDIYNSILVTLLWPICLIAELLHFKNKS